MAGSPPIVDTILQKVRECAVFVADLTFVGKPCQFPNPNVLIEYGYALRCHSHDRLVGIINTAYGKPDAESLPFDLRHLRWPITYHLGDDSAGSSKEEQLEKLVAVLVDAVGLILSKQPSSPAEVANFVPRKSTKNTATTGLACQPIQECQMTPVSRAAMPCPPQVVVGFPPAGLTHRHERYAGGHLNFNGLAGGAWAFPHTATACFFS